MLGTFFPPHQTLPAGLTVLTLLINYSVITNLKLAKLYHSVVPKTFTVTWSLFVAHRRHSQGLVGSSNVNPNIPNAK